MCSVSMGSPWTPLVNEDPAAAPHGVPRSFLFAFRGSWGALAGLVSGLYAGDGELADA